MRKLLLSAAAIGLISSPAGFVQAQQPAAQGATAGHGANAARYGIGVVDISFIFKNYPGFTSQIEALKTKMEAADGALKGDRDKLVQMEEQRNTMKPGSPEFKQMDEQLAHLKAEFQIKQGTVRRDFMEQESRIYYQAYVDVSTAVKSYASQHNIGMVLRFNGDGIERIDPAQREDVMRAMTQPILFQNNIDITPDVLMVLGVDVRTLRPAATTARPGAAPQAR